MHWATKLKRNLEVTLNYIREAARAGSRVVLFPEANLTSYYFPYLVQLPPTDQSWGTREMGIRDLDGNVLIFANMPDETKD